MQLRLDKYLSTMGVASRSDIKDMARAGHITVNDKPVKKADVKVDPNKDTVRVNGQVVEYHEFEYFMLNKPGGVISASSDRFDETVVDLIGGLHRTDLFPVGRLDKDTVGLLLITNDGQLAHRLLAPAKHVDKRYLALLDAPATAEDIEAFQQGIDIGDPDLTLPANLEIDEADPTRTVVTIHEGRYHQVKRMFEAQGKKVVYLKRLSMGALVLDETLQEGESRPLTQEELQLLL